MSRLLPHTLALSIALGFAGIAQAASLQAAAKQLDAANTHTLSFNAAGQWFQFGQAPAPGQAWPRFDVSQYSADINYDTASARVQQTRKQTFDIQRIRPVAVEQRLDQYVSQNQAWNVAPLLAGAANALPTITPQPAAVEDRNAEIWSTPHGFIKAALANQAKTKPVKGGLEVSFSAGGKYRYVGLINKQNLVEKVQTWVDNPILGDTLVETRFSDYRLIDGVRFPSRIERSEAGHPILDLSIGSVSRNAAVEISVPPLVASAPPQAVKVESNRIADGVYYLTGGTHHSVAIEQADHVVVVEAPLNEARSEAVIAKVREIIPGKPIKYLINTHAHFDHAGGLRTYVDAGATIVTHSDNRAYYQQAWAQPRSLNPDKLAQSGKAAKFETFNAKYVLNDGKRAIEIYPLAGNTHNDAFAAVYLPAEKVLIEADAYTPAAANAPAPTSINPYSVNLHDNIEKLKLDVAQIAPLHGRLVTLADLRSAIGQAVASK